MFGRFNDRNRKRLKTYHITFNLAGGEIVETHRVRFRNKVNLRLYVERVTNDSCKITDIFCIDDNSYITVVPLVDSEFHGVLSYCLN